jgi:hypothetical protein
VLVAYLAAVYLTVEAKEPATAEAFRIRALAAAVVTGIMALAVFVLAPDPRMSGQALRATPWAMPLHVATGVSAVSAMVLLLRRQFWWARCSCFCFRPWPPAQCCGLQRCSIDSNSLHRPPGIGQRDDKSVSTRVWRASTSFVPRRIRRSPTGTVIVITNSAMLVEGGYLHSMKLLIEKASETPVPAVVQRTRRGIFSRSLRRLGGFLLGW